MNKVIRMTEEIWNLPAGRSLLHADGRYCALGKLALALGHTSEDIDTAKIYVDFDTIVGERDACNTVFMLNDETDEEGNTLQSNHELAIRTGIEMLLAAGCTLETDDTVSKELARIKSCAEIV